MGNHPLQPQMRNPTRQTAYTEAEGAQYSGVKTHTIQHKLQYHTSNAIKASNMHHNRIDRTVIAPSAWRQSTASSPSSACRHHSPHHCCTHVRCNTHKRTTMCTRRVRMPPLCLCPRPKTAAAVRLSPAPWRLRTPPHTPTHHITRRHTRTDTTAIADMPPVHTISQRHTRPHTPKPRIQPHRRPRILAYHPTPDTPPPCSSHARGASVNATPSLR